MKTVAAIVTFVLLGVAFGQVKSNPPIKTVRVSGVISDFTGTPHRNEVLELEAEGQKITTKTDQDGKFAFPEVPPNRVYQLLLGGSPRVIMGIQVGDTDLETHIGTGLNRPVGITGRITEYTGAVIRNQTVTLQEGGREDLTTQTDQDGKFAFPAVPPNQHFSLHIVVTGLSPAVMDVDAEERDVDMGSIVIQPLGPILATPVIRPVNPSNVPVRAVRISGRITDANGVPMADKALSFENLNILYQSHRIATSTLKTDRNGTFVFPAESHNEYEFYITEPGVPPTLEGLGKIEVPKGQDVEMGNIVLQSSPKQEPMGHLVGPVTVTPIPAAAVSKTPSALTTKAASVAAIFVGADGTNIIHDDGTVLRPPKEKEQVGASSLRISEDKSAVGWLVDSDFCCTSYPLQLMLVVHRPGKPLHRFTGDGRAIFDWKFVGDGKQVALYQDYPHGTPAQHYELRDVETDRLISKWDGDLTPKAPMWAQGLGQ